MEPPCHSKIVFILLCISMHRCCWKSSFFYNEITQLSLMSIFCCCLCNCVCWRQGWTNVTNAFIIFGHQQWLLLSLLLWQKENYNPLFLFHFISIQFHFFFVFAMFCCPSNFCVVVVLVFVVLAYMVLPRLCKKCVCVCATVLPF